MLNSTDPFEASIVNPNLIASDLVSNLKMIIRALQSARRFVDSSPAWQGYIVGEFGSFANATTDAEYWLLAFARANARAVSRLPGSKSAWVVHADVNQISHAVGSCQMSAKDATTGCVDPELEIKGAIGVRIIGGSIFVSLIRKQCCSWRHVPTSGASRGLRA
jgi:choline dehydrogenase-like flavoprotein